LKTLASLNKYLLKYKYRLLLGILFIVVSNYFNILQPRFVREAVDAIAGRLGDSELVWNQDARAGVLHQALSFALLIVGAALLRGVFMFFMRQTIIVMSRLVEYDQKNEIFSQYQRLSLAFYRRHNTGDLMNRISEDVSRVRMYTGPAIMYTLNLVATFAFVIYNMLRVNATLTFYVLLPLPVLSLSIYYVNNIIYRKSDEIQSSLSQITTFVQEAFSGIRVIKAFGAGRFVRSGFERENNTYRDKALSLVRVEAWFIPLMMLLIGLSNLIVIYVGGRQVMAGEISYGNIAEFVIYVTMLTWPVASLGWVTSIVQRAAASQARINEFLHLEPEIDNPSSADFRFEKSIQLENVSFQYQPGEKWALKNIDIRLDKGKVTGVIGTTGSGKSSLAALLLRLYDPSSGNILIDGQKIQSVNLGQYRENLGYVPQDVFLFSDTIAENIAFGLKGDEKSRDRIVEAARSAGVYEDIMNFPDQFETVLGERGISLSGGQKQRIAIARAIVKEPDILILDDCLSAVDTRTESLILKNFREIFTEKTVLVISHRVSSVMNADEIIVLDEGFIVERGNHSSLMAAQGIYAQLFDRQSLQEEQAVEDPEKTEL
jgi:ATP-binding cassette subfamily B multidrug efflux pump